jgi:1-aminocyclopropane-1-carboxylate deaminase/D-cysteine desulfhydrase-like pyridoxal-dependent ACC family enzyme
MPILTPAELEARLNALPRVQLGLWPTPLEAAERLSAAWGGPEILLKRDDLSGLALGGNKVRNLEFRLANALAMGCDTVVMAREPYSNNARQTAAAAIRLGMRMVLLIPSEDPVPMQGNRLLEELMGVDVRVIPTTDPAKVRAAVESVLAAERAAGRAPYDNDGQHPDTYGALGYVAGALELVRQCDARGITPAAVYVAAGFTHSGLHFGLRILGRDWPVVGITVELRRAQLLPRREVVVEHLCALLGLPPDIVPPEDDFAADDTHLGRGFQDVTEATAAAMREAARLDAIILDPFYTGKVMAGLRADIEQGRWPADATVVFLHSGGIPALFSVPEQILGAATVRA